VYADAARQYSDNHERLWQALSSTKRQANSKVVQMVLKPAVSVQTNEKEPTLRLPDHCGFSYWGFLGSTQIPVSL